MQTKFREPSAALKRKVKYVARPDGSFKAIFFEGGVELDPAGGDELATYEGLFPTHEDFMQALKVGPPGDGSYPGEKMTLREQIAQKKQQKAEAYLRERRREEALLESQEASRPYPSNMEEFMRQLR